MFRQKILHIKTKVKLFFAVMLVLILSCQPTRERTILDNCLPIEQVDLLNEMILSFEDDVCKYYNFPKDKSDKAIRKYIDELKMSMGSDSLILKIASAKSTELLERSFTVLSDVVWTTYQEEHGEIQDNIYILEKGDTLDAIIKDELELLKKYKEKHLLRTNGKLIDCLYEKTSFESSKELFDIIMLTGDIAPGIFLNGILSLKPKVFNSKEIEAYIALDLFYSPLDFNSN